MRSGGRGVIERQVWGGIRFRRRYTIGYVGLTESVMMSFDDPEALVRRGVRRQVWQLKTMAISRATALHG
jgi:hypothetical protein